MNKLQAAHNKFHSTRVEAIAAYKMWKASSLDPLDSDANTGYYLNEYRKAWQEHQEASMALFLAEAEEE